MDVSKCYFINHKCPTVLCIINLNKLCIHMNVYTNPHTYTDETNYEHMC